MGHSNDGTRPQGDAGGWPPQGTPPPATCGNCGIGIPAGADRCPLGHPTQPVARSLPTANADGGPRRRPVMLAAAALLAIVAATATVATGIHLLGSDEQASTCTDPAGDLTTTSGYAAVDQQHATAADLREVSVRTSGDTLVVDYVTAGPLDTLPLSGAADEPGHEVSVRVLLSGEDHGLWVEDHVGQSTTASSGDTETTGRRDVDGTAVRLTFTGVDVPDGPVAWRADVNVVHNATLLAVALSDQLGPGGDLLAGGTVVADRCSTGLPFGADGPGQATTGAADPQLPITRWAHPDLLSCMTAVMGQPEEFYDVPPTITPRSTGIAALHSAGQSGVALSCLATQGLTGRPEPAPDTPTPPAADTAPTAGQGTNDDTCPTVQDLAAGDDGQDPDAPASGAPGIQTIATRIRDAWHDGDLEAVAPFVGACALDVLRTQPPVGDGQVLQCTPTQPSPTCVIADGGGDITLHYTWDTTRLTWTVPILQRHTNQ